MTLRRITMGRFFNDPDYDFVRRDGTIANLYALPKKLIRRNFEKMIKSADFRASLRPYLYNFNASSDSEEYGPERIIVYYIPQMEVGQEKTFIGAKRI